MRTFAAFVALIPLAFVLDAATAAPRHGPAAPAFRAHGLFQPVTPRVLSHAGPPARFHGRIPFRANGLLQPLNPEPDRRARRIVRPALIGFPFRPGLAALYNDGYWYGPVDAAPHPAPVAAVAPGGCTTEDVSVPGAGGQTTVTVIRC